MIRLLIVFWTNYRARPFETAVLVLVVLVVKGTRPVLLARARAGVFSRSASICHADPTRKVPFHRAPSGFLALIALTVLRQGWAQVPGRGWGLSDEAWHLKWPRNERVRTRRDIGSTTFNDTLIRDLSRSLLFNGSENAY